MHLKAIFFFFNLQIGNKKGRGKEREKPEAFKISSRQFNPLGFT